MRILFVVIILVPILCGAADPKYPVSLIPEELKQNNYGVIREAQREFRILAINKTSYFFREVYTVLNPNGKFHTKKMINYDAFEKIISIKANTYDAQGNLIRKVKQSEIYDHSAFDGFSLFSDNRYKQLDLSHNVYPYTIEFEYEIEARYLYAIPTFHLYTDDEVGIQKTSYTLVYPPHLKPRYKLLNMKEPTKLSIDGNEKLCWTFENVKPSRFEKLSPDLKFYVPTILVAPTEFEFDGYAGKMDTWENYGKWQWQLNIGRDIMSAETKQKVRTLTDGKSEQEKIKVLYEYLQSKTRYVSVQVGIGGLQPFEAKVVDQVGYGDCKALSNYMISMLKEVGIKGFYTTIWAGDRAQDIVTDFPSHQGNHIIVAVPVKNDTIWLECTSQTSPFNYLGQFTGDRYAHIITESGGKLVRTPAYSPEKNLRARKALVTIEPNGRAQAKVTTTYHNAEVDEDHVGHYASSSAELQKKWLQKTTAIPTFDIVSFTFKNHETKEAKTSVDVELSLPNAATITGKRIFLTPNLMNKVQAIADKSEARKTDVVIEYPYTHIDSIEYKIPENVFPEYLPEPVTLKSRFGDYEARFIIQQGNVLYIRKFVIQKGKYPASSYTELLEFYKNVSRADNAKLVLLNKT